MPRIIAINTANTFAHLYWNLSRAKADPNLRDLGKLDYFLESGVPLSQPATSPTLEHLAVLQQRLTRVKDDLVTYVTGDPPILAATNHTAQEAQELVESYVGTNGVIDIELFRTYELLHSRGNFIHNWLHH